MAIRRDYSAAVAMHRGDHGCVIYSTTRELVRCRSHMRKAMTYPCCALMACIRSNCGSFVRSRRSGVIEM